MLCEVVVSCLFGTHVKKVGLNCFEFIAPRF